MRKTLGTYLSYSLSFVFILFLGCHENHLLNDSRPQKTTKVEFKVHVTDQGTLDPDSIIFLWQGFEHQWLRRFASAWFRQETSGQLSDRDA